MLPQPMSKKKSFAFQKYYQKPLGFMSASENFYLFPGDNQEREKGLDSLNC